MLPAIEAVLHPPTTSKGGGGRGGGDGNPNKPTKDQQDKGNTAKHNFSDLKCSHKMFHLVIQKYGLLLKIIPNPMFNANEEESTKYIFTGVCMNPNCKRKSSHTPPQCQQNLDNARFRSECLTRYNAAKGPSDPAFY